MADALPCPQCQEDVADWAAAHPEARVISRSYVEYLHWQHRPHHPSTVGPARARQARRRWDEWESLSPREADRG